MVSVFSLYDSILVTIFEDWIEGTDLGYLDIAVCSSTTRHRFLSVLKKTRIINFDVTGAGIHDLYQWAVLREVGIRKLSLTQITDLNLSPVISNILKTTQCFNHITLSSGKLLVQLIEIYNFDVISCTFTDKCSDEDVLVVTKALPNLKGLNISDCGGLSDQVCSAICCYCPLLSNFSASMHLNVSKVLESCTHLMELNIGIDEPTSLEACGRTIESFNAKNSITNRMMLLVSDYCPNLLTVNVDVDGGDIDECIVHLVKVCRRLTCLIAGGALSDIGMKAIAEHGKGIRTLKLFASMSTNDGVSAIVIALSGLEELHLSDNKVISNEALCLIGVYCKRLRALSVDDCTNLTELGLLKLYQKCPNLLNLSFHNVPVSPSYLYTIAVGFDSLYLRSRDWKKFSVSVDHGRSDKLTCYGLELKQNYAFVFRENPFLRIFECTDLDITDDMVKTMVTMCPFLEKVALMDCKGITRQSLSHVAKAKLLTTFTFRNINDILERDILELVQDKPSIRSVVLPACSTVTDGMLEVVAQYCPSLVCLNIRCASEVTVNGVSAVLKQCPRLDTMNLIGCRQIDSNVLRCFSGRRMRTLYVTGCSISEEDIRAFKVENNMNLCEFKA